MNKKKYFLFFLGLTGCGPRCSFPVCENQCAKKSFNYGDFIACRDHCNAPGRFVEVRDKEDNYRRTPSDMGIF